MAKKTFSFTTPITPPVPSLDSEILRKTVDDGVRQLESARIVPLARLHPDPEQPRRSMDQPALTDLAESIRQEGILQPLMVSYRYEQDDYLIVSGERRYRAAHLAGLTEVPVMMTNANQTRRFVRQLVENLQREDLNPLDRGQALNHLKTLFPATWQEMAGMVGLTRRRMEQLRALPRMAPLLQDAVRDGRISEDHARTLSRLPASLHAAVLSAVEEHDLSTRRTKDLVARLRQNAPPMAEEPGENESAFASESLIPAAPLPDEAAALVRDTLAALLDVPPVTPPPHALLRSRAAIPLYEKALAFERVLDTMPVLEYQEDWSLLSAILERVAQKIARIRGA